MYCCTVANPKTAMCSWQSASTTRTPRASPYPTLVPPSPTLSVYPRSICVCSARRRRRPLVVFGVIIASLPNSAFFLAFAAAAPRSSARCRFHQQFTDRENGGQRRENGGGGDVGGEGGVNMQMHFLDEEHEPVLLTSKTQR